VRPNELSHLLIVSQLANPHLLSYLFCSLGFATAANDTTPDRRHPRRNARRDEGDDDVRDGVEGKNRERLPAVVVGDVERLEEVVTGRHRAEPADGGRGRVQEVADVGAEELLGVTSASRVRRRCERDDLEVGALDGEVVQQLAEHAPDVVLEGRDPVEPPVAVRHLSVGHEGAVERFHRDEEEGEEIGDGAEGGGEGDDPECPSRLSEEKKLSSSCSLRKGRGKTDEEEVEDLDEEERKADRTRL
jgi:hypothetical protein